MIQVYGCFLIAHFEDLIFYQEVRFLGSPRLPSATLGGLGGLGGLGYARVLERSREDH